jgi:hypothetical protein
MGGKCNSSGMYYWRNGMGLGEGRGYRPALNFWTIYTLSVCGVLGGGGYLQETLVVIV